MFNVSLLELIQLLTLYNSIFTLCIKKHSSWWLAYRVLLSANKINLKNLLEFTISFIYKIKSKKPCMDPCGTPQEILHLIDSWSLNLTYCVQLVKYEKKHLFAIFLILKCSSFLV